MEYFPKDALVWELVLDLFMRDTAPFLDRASPEYGTF